MDRRRFLLTSLAGALAAPLASEAQQARTIPVVGSLWNASEAISAPNVAAVRQGLKELGYVEGRDVTIVSQYADGKFERFPVLVKELIELKPDVIVAAGPQAGRAIKQATSTVPVVMAVISDPVAEGWCRAWPVPGGTSPGSRSRTPS